jgi:O-antigen/teichoic acid export membrane protein
MTQSPLGAATSRPTRDGGAQPPSAPFWRTRGWWGRVGRTTLGVYLAYVLAFLATVVVARGLGPSEFGIVVLAVAIATLFATLLDLTLEEAVVHHGYRLHAEGATAGIRGLLTTSLRLDLAIGVAVSGIVVLLAAPLADLASAGRLDPGLVRLAALVTLAATADSTTSAVLQLAGRPDVRGWGMAGTNLARLAAVLVAVQIGSAEAVVVAYAAANAVGALGQGVVALRLARRRWWRSHTGSRAMSVPPRELVRFGFHSSLSTTIAAAGGALIPVVLGRVAGPTAVGIFRVGMFPVAIADAASSPVRLVLFPEQARLSAHGDLAQLRRAIRVHTLTGIAVSLPVAVAAWFALPWLLPLIFSDSFEEAVLPARIMLIAAVAHVAGSWFKTLPAAVGKPELRAALSLIELVLTIALLIVLAEEGAEGAAIAYSAASLASAFIGVASVRHVLRRAAPGQQP